MGKSPVVKQTDIYDGKVVLTLHLQKNLEYFKGHFPEKSILPGVVQLNWAVEFGYQFFNITKSFSSANNLKFKQFLLPDETVTLVLHWNEEKQQLKFVYEFAARVYASGIVCYV